MDHLRIYTAQAIILKRKPVGETDKLITFFGKRYGKFRAIAKGIRKITSRRAPHLELFSESIVSIHRGKTWDTIGDVTPKTVYTSSYHELGQMAGAYCITEIIDRLLPEREEHVDIYNRFCSALTAIGQNGKEEIIPICSSFSQYVLSELGYIPKNMNSLTFGRIVSITEGVIERKLAAKKMLRQSGLQWS